MENKIKSKHLLSFISQKFTRLKDKIKGLKKNPFFYFGFFALLLLASVSFTQDNLASFNDGFKNSEAVILNTFLNNTASAQKDDLFFDKNEKVSIEPPDLKIIQDNCVCAVSTPTVLTPKVFGTIFGTETQNQKDIIEYTVEPGDTFESIAQNFNISTNTILWANNLTKNSTLKVGQSIVVLPVSGVLHVVKNGDTVSEIAKSYKAKTEDIVSFNELTSQGDVFIGDILIVPGGTIPVKQAPQVAAQTPLANNFFILPVEGTVTQGLHFYNAVDVANKCGTSFYAAASGVVQRVMYGWNLGGGNYITILHPNGVVSYYGHFMTAFVKPGDTVNVGDRIGLVGGGKGMAGSGKSTGCHLHFDIRGAKNPLSKYFIGAALKYSK